ncbi:hypothetical protein KF947_18630 [Halomonas sp. FeN2]|nr:hypothetical protein [Halomonas sp. FeN2]UBR49323.1 hypothetical protein KF947_18630 [Halomonas sp. FeN2]
METTLECARRPHPTDPGPRAESSRESAYAERLYLNANPNIAQVGVEPL